MTAQYNKLESPVQIPVGFITFTREQITLDDDESKSVSSPFLATTLGHCGRRIADPSFIQQKTSEAEVKKLLHSQNKALSLF